MINPTEKDIGRGVIYQGSHPNAELEPGLITSFNDSAVFVRYDGKRHSQATGREDLRWEFKSNGPS